MSFARYLILLLLLQLSCYEVISQVTPRFIWQYEMHAMLQDRLGHIWYHNNGGMVNRFGFYDQEDSELFEELPFCSYANFIKEDNDGMVWISLPCGFYRFNPYKKKFDNIGEMMITQTGQQIGEIISWHPGDNGEIWFSGSALYRYSVKSNKFDLEYKPSEPGIIFNLFGGNNNTIWFSKSINKDSTGLFEFDPGSRRIQRRIYVGYGDETFTAHFNGVEPVRRGEKEDYILKIHKKVFRFNTKSAAVNEILLPARYGSVSSIGNDRTNVLAGTANGMLLRFNPQQNNFSLIWYYTSQKNIRQIFPASNNELAYASVEDGLYPVPAGTDLFPQIARSNDTSLLNITNFLTLAIIKGIAYRPTVTGLKPLNSKDSSAEIRFFPPFRLPSDAGYLLFADDVLTDNFWMLLPASAKNDAIIYYLNTKGHILKTHKLPELPPFSSYLSMDSRKNLWVTSRQGKVSKFRIDSVRLETKPFGQNIDINSCAYLIIDKSDRVWMALRKKGIIRFDPHKKTIDSLVHNPGDTNSVISNQVQSLFEDSKGNIWIGTEDKGISRWNAHTNRFRHYNKKDGLPENSIKNFVEDKSGIIWISSWLEICKYIPAEDRFIRYSAKDGIGKITSLMENGTYRDKDDWIFIRNSLGILRFIPDSLNNYSPTIPRILFGNLHVNNKPVVVGGADSILKQALDFTDVIRLKFSQNKFTVKYFSIEFHEEVKFAYRLRGFENEWQYVGYKTVATYTYVPPGKYVFEVKSSNHHDKWGEPRQLTIYIKAPWYRTWLAYMLYTLAALVLLRAFIRYRSSKLINDKRDLEDKVELRTKELKESLEELKATQTQLVLREKMASLGELTAGIAHEIQNPLNFVNNFSEVNEELLTELKGEMSKGKINDAIVLANDAIENQKKINHHGKRAEAIVKGMLQHSRTSSGHKEPTDLNELAGEYLKLSYHGLRAKDKSFNAKFDTDFDTSIEKINVVPQDIGRVILNLINNAFYAVNEKHALAGLSADQAAGEAYEPTVTLRTRKVNDKIEISVKDNGNGIPQKNLDKIFQPFFTTKPTGQGTGLGLSLSYDIVKAHGGELTVNTKEAEGSEFKITIPAN